MRARYPSDVSREQFEVIQPLLESARKKTAPRKAKKAVKATTRPAASKKTASKKTASRKTASKKTAVKKTAPRKTAKRAAKKKQVMGEGDYQASRSFLKDQSDFVKKNRGSIPKMGKAAEDALDGPEGGELREAEATAGARSRDTF